MGNEFRIDDGQPRWQHDPRITTFQDGSFLIVFENFLNEPDARATVIAGQRHARRVVTRCSTCGKWSSTRSTPVTPRRNGGPVRRDALTDEDIGSVGTPFGLGGHDMASLNNGRFIASTHEHGFEVNRAVSRVIQFRLFDEGGRT